MLELSGPLIQCDHWPYKKGTFGQRQMSTERRWPQGIWGKPATYKPGEAWGYWKETRRKVCNRSFPQSLQRESGPAHNSPLGSWPPEPKGSTFLWFPVTQFVVLCYRRSVVVVQLLSHVRLSETPQTAAHQASQSFTISRSLLKLMSIESMMPSNHLILCHPLLLLPSIFPSIRVFSNELVLKSLSLVWLFANPWTI